MEQWYTSSDALNIVQITKWVNETNIIIVSWIRLKGWRGVGLGSVMIVVVDFFVRLVPYIQFQDLLSFFRRAWKQNFFFVGYHIYVTAVARALWRRRKTAEIGKGTLEKRVKSLEQGKKMSCCAVGCKNRHGQSKDIHFHRIPSTKTPFDAERRCLWLQAINRTDWSDDTIRNARICSVHFISGKVFIHCLSHTKAKSMVKSLIINKLISATTKLPFSVG